MLVVAREVEALQLTEDRGAQVVLHVERDAAADEAADVRADEPDDADDDEQRPATAPSEPVVVHDDVVDDDLLDDRRERSQRPCRRSTRRTASDTRRACGPARNGHSRRIHPPASGRRRARSPSLDALARQCDRLRRSTADRGVPAGCSATSRAWRRSRGSSWRGSWRRGGGRGRRGRAALAQLGGHLDAEPAGRLGVTVDRVQAGLERVGDVAAVHGRPCGGCRPR